MKVTLTTPSGGEVKPPTYPALYKSTRSELVVLFVDRTSFVCLVEGEFFSVGEYQEGQDSQDGSEWGLLAPGSVVTLEND